MGLTRGGPVTGVRRRLALLLAAAVLLMVLAPQATRAVRGSAQAAAVPGPPAVGDCLLEQIPLRDGYESATGFVAPPARIAPCDGPRHGEVVGLTPGRGVTRSQRVQSCSAAIHAYLGVADDQFPFAPWSPTVRAGLVLAGPDEVQRAAGQDWVACIVELHPYGIDPASGMYDGTARAGYAGGRLPSAFAVCRSGRTIVDAAEIPCTRDHSVEVLASTSDVSGEQAATLPRTCDAVAERLTRMPDLSANGRLETTVSSGHVGPEGTVHPGPAADGHVSLALCLIAVVGPGTVDGTLIGLGDAPVPWTG